MEIILHAHHAEVSESLRAQAEAAITRIAKRLHCVANAIVRFVGDGHTRRVEIVLRHARHRELFVHADAPFCRERLQIGDLGFTEDLNALIRKAIEIAGKDEPRA